MLFHYRIIGYYESFQFRYSKASIPVWLQDMINININKTELTAMCELKVILKGKTIMEDVVRLTVDKDTIKLQNLFGESKTVHGRIVDINITKQEAIIDS
jgi:predicted RNA-binding protein